MIVEFREVNQLPQHARIVIVGGGAVGLAMAVYLARNGRNVLVLEAGDENALAAPQDLFADIETLGHPFNGLTAGRLRGLGGTTNLWGGQLVRFDPTVFDERPWLPVSGWPIDFAELDPYYETAFDLLGMQRRLDDAEVWRRTGVTPPACPPDLQLFFTRWAPQPNFAQFFASDLKTNPNLTVLTRAPVTSLELGGEDGRVIGLTVTDGEGRRHTVTGDHIILAQGTIEIARLLKLGSSEDRLAPWANHPWLGRGFVDHVDADAGEVELLDRRRFYRLFDAALLDGLKYLPKLKLAERAQQQGRLLGIAGHFVFKTLNGEELKAVKAIAQGVLRGKLDASLLSSGRLINLMRAALPAVLHYLLRRRVYNPGDQGITLRLSGEQVVVPQSSIHLTNRRDALGMPVVALDWHIDGIEVETMSYFARRVAEFLESEGLARIALDPLLLDSDPRFIEKIEDGYHHMGMARMGTSAADGVVDRNLKVFGTDNLYVAGAAVFPATGFANPTLTAIALGLRLSEHLIEDRS